MQLIRIQYVSKHNTICMHMYKQTNNNNEMDIYVWICENEIEIAERGTHKTN